MKQTLYQAAAAMVLAPLEAAATVPVAWAARVAAMVVARRATGSMADAAG